MRLEGSLGGERRAQACGSDSPLVLSVHCTTTVPLLHCTHSVEFEERARMKLVV